jgi:hypothetical protein
LIKKCHVSRKKLLRSPAPNRKYPLTEAAVTLQRTTGRTKRRACGKKRVMIQAGAPKKDTALPVCFVSHAL